MAAPSTRYARSGDVHLAYQVVGDGSRDVVLALDWASHLEVLWEQPFVQELLASLAGHGRYLAESTGLHTGEVTARNGDVAGIAVDIGARVSTIAAPGDVLLTRTVRDLVAGPGIAFDQKGIFALKGVTEQWDLYATTN